MIIFTKTIDTTKFSSGKNTKEYILLHHTAGGSFEGNLTLLSSATKQVSVHYVVGPNGEIGKIGNEDMILWHAGDGEKLLNGIRYFNPVSIGIEVVSNGYIYTDLQRDAVEKLLIDIVKRNNIKEENIIRHCDITSRKWDIGDNFWNTKFKSFGDYRKNIVKLEKENNMYKEIFTQNYPNGSTVFKDLETAEKTFGDIAYFIAIGLERTKQK